MRGVRESGAAFAIPTYAFMVATFVMIGFAIYRFARGEVIEAESAQWQIKAEAEYAGAALLFLLARAFSSGTTALTGIEAISNGVPAFRKPKSKNAATTLLLLGLIATSMFSGITWLAIKTGVKVTEFPEQIVGFEEGDQQRTVIAQVASAVFENFPAGFYFVASTTALILVLAANTAFNGFPVLGSILARDGYLPRQLHTRGDRLAFSNGILMLAAIAILLVVVYEADVSKLIQLYILGVFVSFTMSQLGMIRHWTRLLKDESDAAQRRVMMRSRAINTVGFLMTGTVLIVVLATKFTHGAWIVCIAMPALYVLMRAIRVHYDNVQAELKVAADQKSTLPSRVHAIVTVSKVHKATLRALNYARASRPTILEAVTVDVDPEATQALQTEWESRKIPVTLRVLDSPYREITRPILDYVESIRANTNDIVIVYVPEYVVGHWWEQFLHNQSAFRLKSRLRFRRGVIVASVPYQLESSLGSSRSGDHQAAGAVRRGQPKDETADKIVAREFGVEE